MVVRKDPSIKERSFTIAARLQIECRLGLYITDQQIYILDRDYPYIPPFFSIRKQAYFLSLLLINTFLKKCRRKKRVNIKMNVLLQAHEKQEGG